MNEQDNTHNLPVWSDKKLKSNVKQYKISEKTIYKTHVIENQFVDQFFFKTSRARLKTFSRHRQEPETTSVLFIIHIHV